MATTKNITMNQFNGTDYDTLYPKTIAEQVDGVYSKEDTITNNTKSLFGLSNTALPDDAFAFLGQYNQHWWRRLPYTASRAAESAFANLYFPVTSSKDNYETFYYSDKYIVDKYGKISLDMTSANAGQERVLVTAVTTVQSNIAGKYFTVRAEIGYRNLDQIFYCGTSATVTYTTNSSATLHYGWTISSGKTLTGVGESFGTNYEYLHSTNRNAYPDYGVAGGYEYEYIGIPFDNTTMPTKIVNGYYYGTGTYGIDNPCSLTFDFAPKAVFILGDYDWDNQYLYTYADRYIWAMLSTMLSTEYIGGLGFGYDYRSGSAYATLGKKSVDGKTFYWYTYDSSSSAPLYQFNGSGHVYHYIAIG